MFAIHFVWGEFVFAPTAPYIVAILFPLVNYTNKACGLFLHRFKVLVESALQVNMFG